MEESLKDLHSVLSSSDVNSLPSGLFLINFTFIFQNDSVEKYTALKELSLYRDGGR